MTETRIQKGTALRRSTNLLTVVGIAATAYVIWSVRHHAVNVVNYRLEATGLPQSFALWIGPAAFMAAWWLSKKRCQDDFSRRSPGGYDRPSIARIILTPFLLPMAVAALWLCGLAFGFVAFCAALLGAGLALQNRACWPARAESPMLERWAPVVLGLAIVSSTVWHAAEQARFWEHFTLGYADFGLFATELEHCLPYKDVGPLRFEDSRLGYHAVFFFYLLAPVYALFRSPLFLMVVGPLALNLAALPLYAMGVAKGMGRTGGLCVALAWLLLPSLTRLPYANTYSFQSVYLAVPWIAAWLHYGLTGRWARCHLCLVAALLCEETVCGVAFGWGTYLLLFSQRRREGLLIMIGSAIYLLVTTQLIIPAFAVSQRYSRLALFGDLNWSTVLSRWTRERVGLYLLALSAPLLPWLWSGRRLLIAVVPTLLLICLMQNDDYLNIKYWHQSTILPFLFAAAVAGAGIVDCRLSIVDLNGERRSENARRELCRTTATDPPSHVVQSTIDNRQSTIESLARPLAAMSQRPTPGPAFALLASVLLFHPWMAWSPRSQARRVYEATPAALPPDPRLEIVAKVQGLAPRGAFVVIATERMAAHFIDARMVYSAASASLTRDYGSPVLLVFDRSDRWDRVVAAGRAQEYLSQAEDAGYAPLWEDGPVIVYGRGE